ncbi:SNARE associated Golgi protein [Dillenia turbinata]|uniref:SNARE associated Golgi protein n=1 Tax=Dillenia turbinata TaxID=194707 RepID=A0AAN8VT53_9MAGN
MTYEVNEREEEGEGEAVPGLRLRMQEEYSKLTSSEDSGRVGERLLGESEEESLLLSTTNGIRSWWWWARFISFCIALVCLAAVCVKWVFPYLMDTGLIPIINWELTTFSKPVLALVVFASLAIFPALLLPSSPSMWVAGMTFGYGLGFLLIMSGVTVGVSLPFLIGSLFRHKIEGMLEKYPKQASFVRLAGEGSWFDQLRSVTLIRISPFPYILYNYCAVATNVSGILIRAFADASKDRHSLTAPQIVFNVLGFCATVVTTVLVTIYAKRQLKKLQSEEELLLA